MTTNTLPAHSRRSLIIHVALMGLPMILLTVSVYKSWPHILASAGGYTRDELARIILVLAALITLVALVWVYHALSARWKQTQRQELIQQNTVMTGFR